MDRLQALRDAQASSGENIGALFEKHGSNRIQVDADEWDEMTAHHNAEQAALEALLLTEQDAIRLMHDCYTRLKQLGWNDPIYCPKDGSEFDVVEAGSTGIHKAHYSGEWPSGSWWIAEAGDLWPSRPTLYRVTEREIAARDELRRRFAEDAQPPIPKDTNDDR
jgi:hypothetical protein